MSVYVDENTKVVVQGITGRDGAFHTKGMLDYGTKVVAGVTPGKKGQEVHGVPVFNDVATAVEKTGANTSIIFVPPQFATDALYEAADAPGMKVVVCVTEGIPPLDMVNIYDFYLDKGVRLIGPNCPGIISPGKSKVGILPGNIFKQGNIGVVSRSGTLTYEVVDSLTRAGLGQSTCIGIGGDQIIGTNFLDALSAFQIDPETQGVVLIGEIGGTDEQEAAKFIADNMDKPVTAFIAGQTAPPGKRMGHAGAIIAGSEGTAAEKIAAFKNVGVPVAKIPSELPELMAKSL
ncbi:succinate--CoA ligase subunit alpha [bacterium]|nr:MAG: succinate--CoA ligase subunit alpha [bacterium]